jgi:hypothetical protein
MASEPVSMKVAEPVSSDKDSTARSDTDDDGMSSGRGGDAKIVTSQPAAKEAVDENDGAAPVASKKASTSLEDLKRMARERGRLKAMQRSVAAQSLPLASGDKTISKDAPTSATAAQSSGGAGGTSSEGDLEGQKALARERGRLLALER